MISILKKQESCISIKDLARENGVSEGCIYNWKAKYGDMEANELKQMKELEEENARLKSIVANLALENDAVKNVLEKKLGRLTTNNK
ncbi:transposase [Chitinophaga sancti]|nr:transposase [Chitinophaga sancti]WQD65941.1 transposase [Chitinophaga sancti]